MTRVKRICSFGGLLMGGVVLGWLTAQISLSKQGTAASSRERLLRSGSKIGNAIVDTSVLPAAEQAIADNLTFRAAFVRGNDLETLGKFLGGRTLKYNRLQRQIYLVVCIETRENTGRRLMNLTMEIVKPERLAGKTIRISGGLLDDDCVYLVEQVVDTDTCLPGDPSFRSLEGKYVFAGDEGPSLRDQIEQSRPTFRIVEMIFQ